MGVGALDTYKLLRTVVSMADIPGQRVRAGESLSLNLADYLPEVQVLVYKVSAPGYVEVSLSGGIMTISGIRPGSVKITVSDGTAIKKTFEVTVE